MILRLKDSSTIELANISIMAKLEIDPRSPLSSQEVKAKAREFDEWGCRFIEICVLCREDAPCDKDMLRSLKGQMLEALCEYNEERKLNPAISSISSMGLTIPLEEGKSVEDPLLFAVAASTPEEIAEFCDKGADIIIDSNALRTPGAPEMVARKGCIAVLSFDQDIIIDEKTEKDPLAVISEFFYERLDACIQAKIDKKRIIIDPMLGLKSTIDFRLKMLGRLKTLTSFGHPLTYEVPRYSLDGEENLTYNMAVSIAVGIFVANQGVGIIRTRQVKDIAMALDTWLALTNSARPFKLSMAVKAKLKQLAKTKKLKKQANESDNDD